MKILISDFDNTFFTLEYYKNIELIQKFVESGNIFIIATGRNLNQLLHDTYDYDIPVSYYICNDGALIYDKSYNLLFEKNIDNLLIKPIFEFLDNNKCFEETWIDNNGDYTNYTDVSANKIVARPKNDNASKEFEKLKEKYPNITGYFSQNWLNIIDESVDKGNAIKILQMKNNWNLEKIYTVGDSINDLKMIEEFNGYAVSNAIDEIKEVSIKEVKDIEELLKVI